MPTAVLGGLAFRSLQPGSWATCGVTTVGAAYCWGATAYLGTGRSDISAVPVAVSGLAAVGTLGAGNAHTCATAPGGLVCWGANQWGQLADGHDRRPVHAQRRRGGPRRPVGVDRHRGPQLRGGRERRRLLLGPELLGQLGDGTMSNGANPTSRAVVGGLAFRRIATGVQHTCALTPSGAAYCWGRNDGALGDSSMLAAATPQAVHGGLTFTVVAAGYGRTCAVTTGHQAACWGADSLGYMPNSTTPLLVGGGLLFDSLAVGQSHACGLTAGGGAYCWGANTIGQLGTGTAGAPSQVPVAVAGGLAFTSLAAGASHTCGLTAAGAAYCWGNGTSGQLGAGATRAPPRPSRSQAV